MTQPETARELASLAANAGRALQDEKRHYEIACKENARLRLMVDEYGAGAGALTDKLKRIRDLHRETCPLVQGEMPPGVTCGMCEVLDAPAAVSAAVAPPTSHGLSVQHADALWDAVAPPGPDRPTYPQQHERVCRAVREILDELLPAPAEETDRQTVAEAALAAVETALCDTLLPDAREEALAGLMKVLPEPANKAAVLHEVADELTRKANKLTERVHDLAYFVAKDRLREAEILDREATELRRMADETATETPTPGQIRTVSNDCCGAEPPQDGAWGDCWCTLPPNHDGDHLCQPCTDRHGAPGWTDQPAAGARQDGAQS